MGNWNKKEKENKPGMGILQVTGQWCDVRISQTNKLQWNEKINKRKNLNNSDQSKAKFQMIQIMVWRLSLVPWEKN